MSLCTLSASSDSDVSAAETAGTGYWTDWINVDPYMNHGTGEFEDCGRIRYEQDKDRRCYLGCEAPIAIKYSLEDAQTTATWTDIGKPTCTCICYIPRKITVLNLFA